MESVDDPPHPRGHGSSGSRAEHIENGLEDEQTRMLRHQREERNASSLLLRTPSCCFPVEQHLIHRFWWSKETVAVVTGGNKGLGLGIVRQLAKEGLTVVLTARDPAKGLDAFYRLKEEGVESVAFHPLDVSSTQSVQDLAAWLRRQFGGLDILINNAGVHCYSESYEDAVETFETNYYGVKRVTTGLLPLLRKSAAGARVVNVSSQAASLKRFKKSCLKDKVSNVDTLNEGMVDDLVTKYLEDLKAGKFRKCKQVEKGQQSMNANNFQFMESKLLVNTYTRVLARSLSFKQPENHKIFVNAICPGSIQTDMATFLVRKPSGVGHDFLHDVFGGCAIQSLEDGVDTLMWIALLPRAGYPNGRFFAHRQEISF